MIRFLIDEDMPRSTAGALRSVGFECYDVRDIDALEAQRIKSFSSGLRKRTVSSSPKI